MINRSKKAKKLLVSKKKLALNARLGNDSLRTITLRKAFRRDFSKHWQDYTNNSESNILANSQWETPQEASHAARGASQIAFEATEKAALSHRQYSWVAANEANEYAKMAHGHSADPDMHGEALDTHERALGYHQIASKEHDDMVRSHTPRSHLHADARDAHLEAAQVHRDAIGEYRDRGVTDNIHVKGVTDNALTPAKQQALEISRTADEHTGDTVFPYHEGSQEYKDNVHFASRASWHARNEAHEGNSFYARYWHGQAALEHNEAAKNAPNEERAELHKRAAITHSIARDAHEDAVNNVKYNPDEPRDKLGKWTKLSSATHATLKSLRSLHHGVEHLEERTKSKVSHLMTKGVTKLPSHIQGLVHGISKALRGGTKLLFANWSMVQRFSDRVAQARGLTPEQSAKIHGVLSSIDLKTFEVFKVGSLLGAHSFHIPAIVTGTLPIATTSYLAWNTVKTGGLAPARAALSIVKDMKDKVIPAQRLAPHIIASGNLPGSMSYNEIVSDSIFSNYTTINSTAREDALATSAQARQESNNALRTTPHDERHPHAYSAEVASSWAHHDARNGDHRMATHYHIEAIEHHQSAIAATNSQEAKLAHTKAIDAHRIAIDAHKDADPTINSKFDTSKPFQGEDYSRDWESHVSGWKQHIQEHYGHLSSSLPKESHDALKHYEAHPWINNYLRSGELPSKEEVNRYSWTTGVNKPHTHEEAVSHTHALDKAFEHTPPSTHHILLHRFIGVGSDEGPAKDLYNKLSNGEIKEGHVIHDKGYQSTSYAKPIGNPGHGAAIHFRIHVPSGSKALPMESAGVKGTSGEDQREVLLPRGANYTVKKVESDKGTRIVHVDYSPSEQDTVSVPKKPSLFKRIFRLGSTKNNPTTNAGQDAANAIVNAMESHHWDDWYDAILVASLDEVSNLYDAIGLANRAYTTHPKYEGETKEDDAEVVLGKWVKDESILTNSTPREDATALSKQAYHESLAAQKVTPQESLHHAGDSVWMASQAHDYAGDNDSSRAVHYHNVAIEHHTRALEDNTWEASREAHQRAISTHRIAIDAHKDADTTINALTPAKEQALAVSRKADEDTTGAFETIRLGRLNSENDEHREARLDAANYSTRAIHYAESGNSEQASHFHLLAARRHEAAANTTEHEPSIQAYRNAATSHYIARDAHLDAVNNKRDNITANALSEPQREASRVSRQADNETARALTDVGRPLIGEHNISADRHSWDAVQEADNGNSVGAIHHHTEAIGHLQRAIELSHPRRDDVRVSLRQAIDAHRIAVDAHTDAVNNKRGSIVNNSMSEVRKQAKSISYQAMAESRGLEPKDYSKWTEGDIPAYRAARASEVAHGHALEGKDPEYVSQMHKNARDFHLEAANLYTNEAVKKAHRDAATRHSIAADAHEDAVNNRSADPDSYIKSNLKQDVYLLNVIFSKYLTQAFTLGLGHTYDASKLISPNHEDTKYHNTAKSEWLNDITQHPDTKGKLISMINDGNKKLAGLDNMEDALRVGDTEILRSYGLGKELAKSRLLIVGGEKTKVTRSGKVRNVSNNIVANALSEPKEEALRLTMQARDETTNAAHEAWRLGGGGIGDSRYPAHVDYHSSIALNRALEGKSSEAAQHHRLAAEHHQLIANIPSIRDEVKQAHIRARDTHNIAADAHTDATMNISKGGHSIGNPNSQPLYYWQMKPDDMVLLKNFSAVTNSIEVVRNIHDEETREASKGALSATKSATKASRALRMPSPTTGNAISHATGAELASRHSNRSRDALKAHEHAIMAHEQASNDHIGAAYDARKNKDAHREASNLHLEAANMHREAVAHYSDSGVGNWTQEARQASENANNASQTAIQRSHASGYLANEVVAPVERANSLRGYGAGVIAMEAHHRAAMAHQFQTAEHDRNRVRLNNPASTTYSPDQATLHETATDAHRQAAHAHIRAAQAINDSMNRPLDNSTNNMTSNSQFEAPQEASHAALGASIEAHRLTHAIDLTDHRTLRRNANDARGNAEIAHQLSRSPGSERGASLHHLIAADRHKSTADSHTELSNSDNEELNNQHREAAKAHREAEVVHRDALSEYEDRGLSGRI